jgi:sarcosine oxidase
MKKNVAVDVAVIGAGVFGAWIAYQLQRSGASVILIDTFGAGNSRASSGGESRVIRMGYGPDEIYTRSALNALRQWQDFFAETGRDLFRATGVLWLARDDDDYAQATSVTLERNQVAMEKLTRSELNHRYPQMEFGETAWGILENRSGVLMARQAVEAVAQQAQQNGASYLNDAVLPPDKRDLLSSIITQGGLTITAGTFVFSCGPWLPKVFPDLLSDLIRVTRQEVFFFGVPAGDHRFSSPHLPAWIDFNDLVYGIPDLDERGLKIAIDAHGPEFDPDTGDRRASEAGLAAVRKVLARRLPALAGAPVKDANVCQYESTWNGDFLIDRHPEIENVWLVGGGSGHGFKHGPSVAQYLLGQLSGEGRTEPRFLLSSKLKGRQRQVY